MKKIFLIIFFVNIVSYCNGEKNGNPPNKLEISMDGDPVYSDEDYEPFYHRIPFPFTDIGMQKNQFIYEAKIDNFIFLELNSSNDTNRTIQKFPYNTDLNITIQDKYAHLLLIDEKGLNLYTFAYELFLSKCGATSHNIRQLNRVFKKADIFKLNSMPLKNYRLILQSLLMEALKNINIPNLENEKALFISIDPSVTFLPAAVIEDTLENLRMSFEQLNIRYCYECKEIIPYDEYGYLSWYSSANKGKSKEDFFDFNFSSEKLITFGINDKTIFTAYPLDLIGSNLETDKLSHHSFCNNNHTFVQNSYYERGLEQFTDDIIVYFIKNEFKKREISSSENTIYFPCFPENYWELMSNIEVYGSGSYEDCKKLIQDYLKIKSEEKISSDFGFNYQATWPLENLDDVTLKNVDIIIESDVIKQMLTEDANYKGEKKSYEIITPKKLELDIEKICNSMFESGKAQSFSNSVKTLSKCIHLVYTREIMQKMKISEDKDIKLKLKNSEWIQGLIYENLLVFHDKEKDWFYQSQSRSIEGFFYNIQKQLEHEKAKVITVAIEILTVLIITFAIGFVVRYKAKDIDVIENLSKKR